MQVGGGGEGFVLPFFPLLCKKTGWLVFWPLKGTEYQQALSLTLGTKAR